ncbi:isochorismate synthase [Teredinibacter haidensis]|uniref:isochorismate synthase n=1 Tax=Teredinibacter haidensis TaxID=2731755 RepID=UPI000948E47D|nr:isochorismate synthase [Teredinibacter haidensis]
MKVQFAEKNRFSIALPSHPDFLFCSSHRSLKAYGLFERISTPVEGQGGQSQFTAGLNDALGRAAQSGVVDPVVIGAIPFDLSQPSSLYIPLNAEFCNRDRLDIPNKVPVNELSVVSSRSYPEEQRYKQSVQQAIANFQLSDIRKAVVSRVLELELNDTVEVDSIFNTLVDQNTSGYHFRVPLEGGGNLIGVSPELLVRKEGECIYSNPLAGSAKRQSDALRDSEMAQQLSQSAKDHYEHRLVIEEIDRVLRPFCKELTVPEDPSLLSTESMWHLSTAIEGQLHNPQTSALALACMLHPTPAVCGYPTRQAHKLINLVESFDRGLFAGMVGWLDSKGNGEWVVTIRCGIARNNNIRLFAGAGIVEQSCPEAEWAETQAKMQTMIKALPFAVEPAL